MSIHHERAAPLADPQNKESPKCPVNSDKLNYPQQKITKGE
jgi:hypothetical protein